jgi:hypothetical protein
VKQSEAKFFHHFEQEVEEDEFQHEYEGQEHGDFIVIPIPSNEADHNVDGVYQIIIENVSNRQLKTNLLNTLASPGLQAIEPKATAEVVNGQMSWAKLYKTSS